MAFEIYDLDAERFIVGPLRRRFLIANPDVFGFQSEKPLGGTARRHLLPVKNQVRDAVGALPWMNYSPPHRRPDPLDQRLVSKKNLRAIDHAEQQREKREQDERRLDQSLSLLAPHRSLSPGANRPTKGNSTPGRPSRAMVLNTAFTG